MFPDNYLVFRNDRVAKGGGVFLGIHSKITATEHSNLVSNCETAWAKLKLQSNKDLYGGSFYMPHRNSNDLDKLNQSLSIINQNSQKQVILVFGFGLRLATSHQI